MHTHSPNQMQPTAPAQRVTGAYTRRITWTQHADARLVALYAEGTSLRALARAFNLSRHSLVERAVELGVQLRPVRSTAMSADRAGGPEVDEPGRDPLPAGHALTWGLINQGTCLQGQAYHAPPDPRRRSGDA